MRFPLIIGIFMVIVLGIGAPAVGVDTTSTTVVTSPRPKVAVPAPINVEARRDGAAVEHVVGGAGPESNWADTPAPGSSSAGSRRGGVAGPPPPPTWSAYIPTVVRRGQAGQCLGQLRVRFADPASAIAVNDRYEQRWLRLSNTYQPCPGVVRPGQPGPAGEAVRWWRQSGEDLLPRPQPFIAPGWMLAGKPGFLEARVDLADRFEHPTPLGLLVIDVQGEIFVDWGDGTAVEGPLRRTGAPWPDGDITHVWTHAGRYDVVVTARWAGTWSLGDTRGELTDLVTEGRIDDFQIRGLEAVRNR